MSRGVTKPAVMLEQQQAPAAHLTAGGGVVVFEHLLQRLPQQFQVVVGETGLLGQRGADEAVVAVDGVERPLSTIMYSSQLCIDLRLEDRRLQ